jgi:hypothetical protein
MASSDINLLQTKTESQSMIGLVGRYIRIVSVGIVSTVLIAGFLLGLTWYLMSAKRDGLLAEKKQVMAQIEQDKQKESLLMLVRDRLTSIGSIIDTQKSFAPYIDTTLTILKSYTLSSFGLGEKNTVNVTITVRSLDDAMEVLTTIMGMEANHMINHPILKTFMMEGGKIQLGLAYTVVI